MEIVQEQIKPGYKKTKLGWIPEDWKPLTLNDISLSMKSGLSRKLSADDIGLPVIRSNNLNKNKVDFSDIKYWHTIDPQGSKTQDYFLQDGDILVNFINSLAQIGKCAYFKNELNRDVIYTTNILALRLNKRIVLPEIFLANTFLSRYLNYVKSITKPAVNQASFTTKEFKKLKLPIPPLPEQQKIAKILSTWDKAIEKQEALIAQKQQLKKGLMQQLLTGKKRFKEFVEDWEQFKLGELIKLSSGSTKPKFFKEQTSSKAPIPIYGGNGITGYTNKSNIVGHHIIIGRVGEYCGVVHDVKGEAWVTDNALLIKEVFGNVDVQFLGMILHYYKLSNLRNKGGQPLISQKPIYNLKVLIPIMNEQQKIASVLSAADKEIENLQQQLTQFKTQKKGLMQKLLTGEVRVKIENIKP